MLLFALSASAAPETIQGRWKLIAAEDLAPMARLDDTRGENIL